MQRCDQLAIERFFDDAAVVDEQDRVALDDAVDLFVVVKEPYDHEVEGHEHDGADQSAGDGVVVADDGVLNRVRDRQQDDEIVRVQLRQFALAKKTDEYQQCRIDDQGPEDLLQQRNTGDEHVRPGHEHSPGRGMSRRV
jgi:hypothetical protein